MVDEERSEIASLDGLQDECLLLILRALEASGPAAGQHEDERAARLQSWRSLLWTSRRVRRLALSAELDVWHVLNHERVQALQPDGSAVAVAYVLKAALRAPRRCGHLRCLDLSGFLPRDHSPPPFPSESDGDAQPSATVFAEEQADLIRLHCTSLESLRLAGQFGESLRHYIDVLPALGKLNSLVIGGECYITDSQLMMLEPASLPHLERLSLAECRQIVGRCFPTLLESAPRMTLLNVAGGKVVRRHLTCFANLGRALAVKALYTDSPLQNLEAAPSEQGEAGEGRGGTGRGEGRGLRRGAVPVPLRVTCGQCGVVIWERLASYVLVGGQQPHIHSEIWTHEPPDLGALAQHAQEAGLPAGDCRRFLCRNQCHGQRLSMWLVDRNSGLIQNAGFTWGIACGPGSPQLGGLALGFYDAVEVSADELKQRQLRTITPYDDWCPV